MAVFMLQAVKPLRVLSYCLACPPAMWAVPPTTEGHGPEGLDEVKADRGPEASSHLLASRRPLHLGLYIAGIQGYT